MSNRENAINFRDETGRNSNQQFRINIPHDPLRAINEHTTRAHEVCRESEVIAADSLDELARQRETLARTRDGLQDANQELDTTNKTLKSMHMRIATNKLLLHFIILMEVVIIGCQIYLKFFKSK